LSKLPIRVLVVDDSVVIRKLLGDLFAQDPAIEVAGFAADGRSALAKVAARQPDLVTLDIEMPEMDGLATLAELRRSYPRLPVIMFSTLTERGASATLEALALGATDYATKPSNTGSASLAAEAIRLDLIPKIKALCAETPHPAPVAAPSKARWPGSHRIDIVAIGSSTGGPNALMSVIPNLPPDFPVPVVITQHMPPIFTSSLAQMLGKRSVLVVEEAREGASLAPGHVWVAPGDFHMTITGGSPRLSLSQGPPENSCRPAVDVMFRSVAAVYQSRVLAVVLTGMGADGTAGARCIRSAGGEVIVQDQSTSVVWGMPGSIHANGLANAVYPLPDLAPEITRRVMASRIASSLRAARA